MSSVYCGLIYVFFQYLSPHYLISNINKYSHKSIPIVTINVCYALHVLKRLCPEATAVLHFKTVLYSSYVILVGHLHSATAVFIS